MEQEMIAGARKHRAALLLKHGGMAVSLLGEGETEILLHQHLASKIFTGLLKAQLHCLECAVRAIALENAERESGVRMASLSRPAK